MISYQRTSWTSIVALVGISVVMTGCASSGNPLAKLSPSNIKKSWNRSRTGLEDPATVHKTYAEWQESQGNLVEARKSYSYVLDHDSKSVDSILGLARLDQLAGNTEQAEKQIQKAQSIAPNDPRVKVALGKFYVSQGRHSEAVDELRQASLLTPNDKQVQYELGVALARSGDVEGSRPYFIRTVGEAESHYNIAYILNEEGQWADAEQELMASLQKKPQLQDAQLLLEQIRKQHAPQQMLAQQQYVDPGYVAAQQMAMQQQMALQQQMMAQQPSYAQQPGYGQHQVAPQQQYGGQQPYVGQNAVMPRGQLAYPNQPLQQAAGQQQQQAQPQVKQLSGQNAPGQQNVRDAYYQQNAGQQQVNPFQQISGQQQMPTINSLR